MQKLWTTLILLLVLTIGLAGCAAPAAAPTGGATGEEQAAAPAAEGPQGTLRIGLTTDIAAIESPYAPERQADNAAWTLYDGLVFPEIDGTYSPALAESWEVSEDGTTYTFHLRQGVTFHNGEPFTADAVVYSWQVYSQPEVTYANEWSFAQAVEKVDDYTVTVSTAEPNALLLAQVAGWSIIPPQAHAEMGREAFAQSPIGTGPFMFQEWVKGDHLTVVANPNYWREGYPKVAEVVFRFMPESATRVAAIQAGEIDIAPRLTADEADLLAGYDDLTVIDYPVDRVYYIAFNNMTTGLDTPIMDVNVRQAIAHAIDVQTIIDSIFSGAASRAVGLVTQNNLGYVDAEPIAYDVEQAKALLSEAGYPDGFAIGMACPEAAYANINEVCQAIQGYLTDVGINVDLELQEANAFWQREENKELPPLFVDSWSNTLNEAYNRIEGAVGKDQAYANWSDEKFHTLLAQIISTPDVDARAALYGDLQTYMHETMPFVFLYSPQAFEGVNNRVQNYQPRGAEEYYLWDVSVSE
ncbi:MAG: ABC transporter substrate-binding protein [Caldilineaceae bacterium]